MKLKRFFASLLLPFFLITTVYAQENLLKERIDDFTGGMVSNSLPELLSTPQSASMVNVDIGRKGILTKRKGQGLFAQDVGNSAFTGLGRFDPDANTSYLVIASGVRIARSTAAASSWTIANPASPLTTGLDTDFVQANDLLFVLNGFDPTTWYSGASWITASTYPTSPPTARTGAWVRNYLFLAGEPSQRDWVYFSNNLDPTKFDASDIRKINTGDGQIIQALVPYRENEIIVYKERSIFVLDITGVPDDWTVQPISTVVGTPAPRSVVSLGNDHWFLSNEPFAVRSLVRTQFDKILVDIVSAPIQDIFDATGRITLNRTHVQKSAAVLFQNNFFLAIPTGSSTVNNTVLAWDFLNKAWYIIDGWFPAEWVVFDNRLFYMDANDGRVIECFKDSDGDWPKGPGTIDSASSPTVAISFVYMSRALTFNNVENFKELDSLEVEFDPTGNYNATIYINLDNDGWQNIGTVNLAGNSLTLPITLPTALQNSGVARKNFSLTRYGEFRKMQVMVVQGGLDQGVGLQRITVFARMKPWRRN